MSDARYAALAREWLTKDIGTRFEEQRIIDSLAALLARVADEARADADETPCDNCAQRRAWLDAVSGALLDAGATVGDETTYADAVRRLIPEVCAVARAQERVRIVREMGHLADPPLDPVEYFRREFKRAGEVGRAEGVLAERERCAKVAESHVGWIVRSSHGSLESAGTWASAANDGAARRIATLIRAGNETP